MSRTPVVSVTRKDLVRQTFTVGGNGGSGKDTSNTGVRLIHPPSGAVGEGREYRSQEKNQRAAFIRLVGSPKFAAWIKLEHALKLGTLESPEAIRARVDAQFDEDLRRGLVKEEYF